MFLIPILILSTIVTFAIAFTAYPKFPMAIRGLTLFLLITAIAGAYIFFLAPRDYMLRIPEEFATILHPYVVVFVTVAATSLLIGASVGAFSSCLRQNRGNSIDP